MSAITKRPFLPKITIKKNDASLYTYDPFVPTFDFRLISATIRAPHDSSGGQFNFTIGSSDVTNSAMNTILNNIQEDNEVTIWVGKTSATLIKIFLGKIESIEISEPNKDLMYVTISGPDWGSDILKNLRINHSWVQKKDVADQNKLKADDPDTRIGKIIKDMFTEPSIYPDLNYPVTATDLGIIFTAGNYPDADTSHQLPSFEANMETIDDKLTELDELAGTTHFVDADKTFFMKPSTSIALSGVLLTDDPNDSDIATVGNGNVGFIAPNSKYNITVENHKARLYGVGSNTFDKDKSQEIVTGTDNINLDTNWYAQRFTPDKQDCYQIGVYIGYSGTPSRDLTLLLVEDKNNLPEGSTLRSVSKSYKFLTTTGAWHYFPMDVKLTKGVNYWVVLAGGTTYRWYNDNINAGTSTSATSTTGNPGTWALTVNPKKYTYSFINFSNDPLIIAYPVGTSSSTKHLHDEVITRLDIKDNQALFEYIRGLYLRMGKRKEIFKGRIYAPDRLLKPNEYVWIKKTLSGKQINGSLGAFFVLGEVEYIFDSADETSTGTMYINVEATRFVDYP